MENNNEEIRKEFIKDEIYNYSLGYDADYKEIASDIADWWLNKMNLQKQQMIEKGEKMKKYRVGRLNLGVTKGDWKIDGYNQAITDYQNLIKKENE